MYILQLVCLSFFNTQQPIFYKFNWLISIVFYILPVSTISFRAVQFYNINTV